VIATPRVSGIGRNVVASFPDGAPLADVMASRRGRRAVVTLVATFGMVR
jgi:hypothetical protein